MNELTSNKEKTVIAYFKGKPELIVMPAGWSSYAGKVRDIIESGKINGKTLHRPYLEGPAACLPNGVELYFEHGKLHRLDGPAVVNLDGHREYWVNGKKHRDPKEGPAVIGDANYKAYYVNGKLHNPFGVALTTLGGEQYYYLHGVRLSKNKWLKDKDVTTSEEDSLKKEKQKAKKLIMSYLQDNDDLRDAFEVLGLKL